MELPSFFRATGKVAGHFFLVVGVLASIMVAAYLGFALLMLRGGGSPSVDVPAAGKAAPKQKLELSAFEAVSGTAYVRAPYGASGEDRSYGSSYGGSTAVRNYLFVNAADLSSRWLVPGLNALILSSERLSGPVDPSKGKSVPYFRYDVVKTDTDGDKRLTDRDRLTLAVSDLSGANYAEIVPDVNEVLGERVRDAQTWVVIYRKGARCFASEVRLPDHRVTRTREVPLLQPAK